MIEQPWSGFLVLVGFLVAAAVVFVLLLSFYDRSRSTVAVGLLIVWMVAVVVILGVMFSASI